MATQAHTADIDLDLDDTYARVNDLPLGDSDKPAGQTKCDTVAESKLLVSPQTYDSTFPVGIEETEASKRCTLCDGDYRLCVNACDISLKNQHVVLYSWPYKAIRRCGTGKGLFIVEVGRRAASGEGFFRFKTTSSETLLKAVTVAMRTDSSRHAAPPADVEDLYAKVNKPKHRQKEQ
ncbi:hypothetical protein NP493_21g02022 [Ridgeia piscesae]|uniref:IRS-type PTB domain-containing protein n=1 Tax=Ridgeia piscesae TaxID=27915 RepID=A0AAD9UKG3_RIDPI|nr:hypothetical protein NP493_21g02022 [Ridgeia piscesae]